MLIVQYNYGHRYKSTIMALEIALNIGAEVVILQNSFIDNQELVYSTFNFY